MGFYWAIGARKQGLKGLMIVCEPSEIKEYVERWEGEVELKVNRNLPSFLQNTALDPLEFTEIEYLFFSTKQGDAVVAELARACVFLDSAEYVEQNSGDSPLKLYYQIQRILEVNCEDSPALSGFSSQQRMLTREDQLIRMLDAQRYEAMWVSKPALRLTLNEAISALAEEYAVATEQITITIAGK